MKLSQNSVKRISECGLIGNLTSFPAPQQVLVQITSWTNIEKKMGLTARLVISDGVTQMTALVSENAATKLVGCAENDVIRIDVSK